MRQSRLSERWRKRPTAPSEGSEQPVVGPDWLWFWLVLYLVSFPRQVVTVWLPMLQDLLSTRSGPGEALLPLTTVLRLANLAELVPLVLVALGVGSVALPKLRGRRLEARYGLGSPPDLVSVAEMQAFFAAKAPSVVLRANLLRSDVLALAYPRSMRRHAVAVFGPTVKLWVRDREVAEAILLHEAAHVCRGDALAVGAGSFFRFLLDRWLMIVVLLLVLPAVLVWSIDATRFLVADSLLTAEVRLGHKLLQVTTQALPILLRTMGGLVLGAASAVVLPLAATWSAELAADAAVVGAQDSRRPLLRALDTLTVAETWRDWLACGISHPTVQLRRVLVTHSASQVVRVLSVLALPLGYVARGAILLARAVLSYVGQLPPPELILRLKEHAQTYVAAIAPAWLAMGVYLLIWPWAGSRWTTLWCGRRASCSRAQTQASALGAAVLLSVALACWLF